MEALLGHGSMGCVRRARCAWADGTVVAVKWVPMAGDPSVAAGVRQEAELLNSLQHPHILRILDVIDNDAGLAVVTEYAEGGSLAEVMAGEGRLPWARMARLAIGVADALDAAHRHGVLHGDLKPSNILLTAGGAPLVSDFGLARWTAGTPGAQGREGSGAGIGTAEYLDVAGANGMSPDGRSDVYSLGVVCYQMLTGELPFGGPSPTAVLAAARSGKPRPIRARAPEVPADLARIVERAMERRACNRPASAGELARSLRVAAALPLAAVAGPPPPESSGSSGSSRSAAAIARSTALVLAIAAGVALLVLAWVLIAGQPARPRPGPPSAARRQKATAVRTGCAPTPPSAAGSASGPTGDIRGDGCRVTVSWTGNVAEAVIDASGLPARFRMGEPGDVLLLGDWGCRGPDVPGLYRPRNGDVFLFARWAEPGEQLAPEAAVHTGVARGRARVARSSGDGCDRVVVDRPGVGKHMRPRQSG